VKRADGAPLRIALLDHAYPSPAVRELATALASAGHEPAVLTCHRIGTPSSADGQLAIVDVSRLPEAPLRWRGFERPLTQLPLAVRELATGGYDVAHAFSPTDAMAALGWRRLRHGPVVFTLAEMLERDRLANRRLTLRLIAAAVDGSDALVASNEEVAATVLRWLAIEPRVIRPGDADAHEELYRELLAAGRHDP
jgi:hypothetical protein